MIADNPLGVGPNHYVFVANTEGYSAKAGVTWASGSRNANVHDSFLLVLAETGYLGLFTLIMLLGSGMFYAFDGAVRFRRFVGSETFVGLGCAIVSIVLHANYEWMLVVFPSQYLLAIALGLVSGMRSFYSQLQSASRTRPSSTRQAAWRSLEPVHNVNRPASMS
jgi:O-antigen ligase